MQHRDRTGASPSRLLLEVLLAAVRDLLHHAQVVLRARTERRREVARLLQETLARRGGLLDKLRRERVELLQPTGLLVEQAADAAVRTALLVEVRD